MAEYESLAEFTLTLKDEDEIEDDEQFQQAIENLQVFFVSSLLSGFYIYLSAIRTEHFFILCTAHVV